MPDAWEAKLTDDQREELQCLRVDAELMRLALVEAKVAFDRACDALYLLARSLKGESS